ncbi:MAG: hypothetical protein SPG64_00345 [Candidatus Enteromonas sp.]|nr:hypothetical protein [Candidatus Enteromonas sp.]
MVDKKGLAVFIVRCAWLLLALIIWIVALNMVLSSSYSDSFAAAGFLCLIPMALPVIRFIIRAVRGAANAGSNVYDVNVTSYGHVTVTNNSWWYGLIALLIVSVLTVFCGIFILPVYWVYFAICTVIVGIRLFRRS